MTDRYFAKFPVITYGGQAMIDITRRVAMANTVAADRSLYYSYDVKQYERADSLADRYYDDPYMSWLFYMTNGVVDPYYDWYIDQDSFNALVVAKYGTLQRALNKTKYYRNNWYDSQGTIAVELYNALDASLLKYYEPNYSDATSTTPVSYSRKRIDWIINTNAVVNFTSDAGASMVIDELATVSYADTTSCTGQVCFANSSSFSLQHVTNAVVTDIGLFNQATVDTRESGQTDVPVTGAVLLASNIPAIEAPYWSPVTYMDYETERNERNRSIRVLDNRYASAASDDVEALLSG